METRSKSDSRIEVVDGHNRIIKVGRGVEVAPTSSEMVRIINKEKIPLQAGIIEDSKEDTKLTADL